MYLFTLVTFTSSVCCVKIWCVFNEARFAESTRIRATPEYLTINLLWLCCLCKILYLDMKITNITISFEKINVATHLDFQYETLRDFLPHAMQQNIKNKILCGHLFSRHIYHMYCIFTFRIVIIISFYVRRIS